VYKLSYLLTYLHSEPQKTTVHERYRQTGQTTNREHRVNRFTNGRPKTANIIKTKLNQLLLVVNATALKQQISKLCPQILGTEASFYIYNRPLTDTNVIASVYVR